MFKLANFFGSSEVLISIIEMQFFKSHKQNILEAKAAFILWMCVRVFIF